MIKGIPVVLRSYMPGAPDPFGKPTESYADPVTVLNVLVAPTGTSDIIDGTCLDGKHATAVIAIPKGDTHVWKDGIVEFFGHRWKVHGEALEGIENMIPLGWHRQWNVERFDG